MTEDSYNSYSHEYQITSTLTAADNTSDVAQGLGVGTYAYGSAEAAIEWTELTAGNFILATEHKIVCPYWNMEYWESFTYAEKTLNHFGTETFHYIVDYPKLAPNKCAYDLCADQEQRDCYWWAYGSEDYSASNPADGSDGCFKYLSRSYVRVTDPWAGSNWCIKGSKRGSDEKPPGYCGY